MNDCQHEGSGGGTGVGSALDANRADVCPSPRPTPPDRHPATALLWAKFEPNVGRLSPDKRDRIERLLRQMDYELWFLESKLAS